jgi:membrane-associated phospholipid phosphatase
LALCNSRLAEKNRIDYCGHVSDFISQIAHYLDSLLHHYEGLWPSACTWWFSTILEPKFHSVAYIFLLASTKLQSPKIRQAAFGSLFLYPLVFVVKCSVGRARPYLNEDIFSCAPFSFNELYSSFPSSHAAALGLFLSIFRPRLWPLLAPLALVRVLEGVHYPSDVLAGFMIGFFIPRFSNRILSIVASVPPLSTLIKYFKPASSP